MTQTSSSPPDLSPDDAERYAAAFRPSWEPDEPNGAAPIALAATLPLNNAVAAAVPPPDVSSNRVFQKTLMMADAPARADASGPLPSFDLPVSVAKLPPSPVSESDVAKTALYKSVNAADVSLPDDDDVAPLKKKNTPLFIGIGIAALLAVIAGIAVATSSSEPAKTTPSAETAPLKAATADIPPPAPVTAESKPAAAPATPGMNVPKAAATEAKVKPEPKAAAVPAAPPQKPAPGTAAPVPAKPSGKPAGGIVRDAPF